MMKARRVVAVLVTLFLAAVAVGTPLDDYIAKPDASYSYSVVNTIDNPLGKIYVIDMKSQTWRTEKEVNRTLWQHWLTITVPNDVTSDTALLWINGGSNGGKPPSMPDMMTAQIALQSKTVVADLKMVPNQPLVFADDPGNQRYEDAIIAYTFDKFLKTQDGSWPLLLPMAKSAVRAMDAVQDHIAKVGAGKLKINSFVVSGGSKRGWTTWLTAAVDKRVKAIAPCVIDVLNMGPQMQHHFAAYGFYSKAIGDYEQMKVLNRMDSQGGSSIRNFVDPYEYRDRYTMPKFIINSAGDQYFLCDSAQFYFQDLPAPKYLLYNPNTEHSLSGSNADKALLVWYMAILNNRPLPEFSWNIAGAGHTVVTAKTKPTQVNLWTATNPNARDFRLETIGKAWKSSSLAANDKGVYDTDVKAPEKGWTAYFVELLFDSGSSLPYRFSTEVRVIPDTLPFAEKLKGKTVTQDISHESQAAKPIPGQVNQAEPLEITLRSVETATKCTVYFGDGPAISYPAPVFGGGGAPVAFIATEDNGEKGGYQLGEITVTEPNTELLIFVCGIRNTSQADQGFTPLDIAIDDEKASLSAMGAKDVPFAKPKARWDALKNGKPRVIPPGKSADYIYVFHVAKDSFLRRLTYKGRQVADLKPEVKASK